jgi:hypothetical protein
MQLAPDGVWQQMSNVPQFALVASHVAVRAHGPCPGGLHVAVPRYAQQTSPTAHRVDPHWIPCAIVPSTEPSVGTPDSHTPWKQVVPAGQRLFSPQRNRVSE